MTRNWLIALGTMIAIIHSTAFAEEITITVKGMVCSFCAQGITQTFSKIGDVTDVKVDLDNKVVKLKTREGESMTDEVLRQAIEDAGYEAVRIEREENG